MILSRVGCAGDALFLGNSMPIRDMDMYATAPQRAPAACGSAGPGSGPVSPALYAASAQGAAAAGVGAPVAANRGASGIDGVLSTAAGCAHACLMSTRVEAAGVHGCGKLYFLATRCIT